MVTLFEDPSEDGADDRVDRYSRVDVLLYLKISARKNYPVFGYNQSVKGLQGCKWELNMFTTVLIHQRVFIPFDADERATIGSTALKERVDFP